MQPRNFIKNVPKILDLKSSSEQKIDLGIGVGYCKLFFETRCCFAGKCINPGTNGRNNAGEELPTLWMLHVASFCICCCALLRKV